jgi:hypothetical protein
MENQPSDDEIADPAIVRARLLSGWQQAPSTPGLKEIAREILRPRIEAMRGREILYKCRVPWLVRIGRLEVDDEGFRARALPIREVRDGSWHMEMNKPFSFGARWAGFRVLGRAIGIAMLTDHFFPDPEFVARVKRAAEAGAPPAEIAALLRGAMARA